MAVPRNARVNSTVPALPKTSQLRRALIGSVASLVASAQSSPTLAQGAYGGTPAPPLSDGEPIQLPTLAVEGAQKSTEGGYKADQSSLGKLTEPLVNTPFTVETVTRQLMDDQGVAQRTGHQPLRQARAVRKAIA